MKKLLSVLMALIVVFALGITAQAEQGDIVILYTNDVHCAIDGAIGYAGLATMKNGFLSEGNAVALVDIGDAIQGEAVGTLTKGEAIIELMNAMGYDLAVPGNHEFDYGLERFGELVAKADFPYISANFTDLAKGETVLQSYQMLELAGKKIAFVGICTPWTLVTTTPKFFQNEAGEYVYGFCEDETGEKFYGVVQAAVDAARAQGADYVVALAHLGIEASAAPYMSTDLILNTTGIDVVLDGHSHNVILSEKVQNKEGREVLLSSTGSKLQNVGKLTIKADGSLGTELIACYKDPGMAQVVEDINAQNRALLNTVVAKTQVHLLSSIPPAVEGEWSTLVVRMAETNLGDLYADSVRYATGADIGIINGGNVRANLAVGDITNNDLITVSPYGNELCVLEVTGQTILDALEFASRSVPVPIGGFLQVSGLSFEIHTYLESSVLTDDKGVFSGVGGEYRVKNVLVGGAPLALEKVYTLAGSNYILKDSGDGFTMFAGCKLVQDSVILDNQAFADYIVGELGGVVGQQYAEPYGEGRIVAVEEAQIQ